MTAPGLSIQVVIVKPINPFCKDFHKVTFIDRAPCRSLREIKKMWNEAHLAVTPLFEETHNPLDDREVINIVIVVLDLVTDLLMSAG